MELSRYLQYKPCVSSHAYFTGAAFKKCVPELRVVLRADLFKSRTTR